MQQPADDIADRMQLVLLSCTWQRLDTLSITELSTPSAGVKLLSTAVSNLGVVIDGQPSMVNHVLHRSVGRLFQLRQLLLVLLSLS